MHMKALEADVTVKSADRDGGTHTRRAYLEPVDAGVGGAVLRPGPFLSTALSHLHLFNFFFKFNW